MDWQLATHGVAFLANAALYFAIGRIFAKASTGPHDAARARAAFATWWVAIGITGLVQAVQVGAALTGARSVALHMTILIVTFALLAVALCGLVYYLAFLFAGARAKLWPFVAAYAAFFVLALQYVVAASPDAVIVNAWSVELAYETPPPDAFRALLFGFIVGPQIVGALAYATLLRVTKEATLRYRIALVSTGIVLWSLHTLAEGARILGTNDAFQIALRAIGIGAILLVLFAYRPPAYVRRRLDGQTAEA